MKGFSETTLKFYRTTWRFNPKTELFPQIPRYTQQLRMRIPADSSAGVTLLNLQIKFERSCYVIALTPRYCTRRVIG
jgi:hypothetical protein